MSKLGMSGMKSDASGKGKVGHAVHFDHLPVTIKYENPGHVTGTWYEEVHVSQAAATLRTHSTLEVDTRHGPRSLQLLFGDITTLPMEEKVDFIMVSAFAGDYQATPTSVIGALKRKFGISVQALALNKQEDLRNLFHCWWSHPLHENIPFGQLLCFETPHAWGFRHPADLVSDVFRSLVPIFKNKEKTVITPLLATGDQSFSKQRMLRAMLDAAINWIRAGLPLKCLKIVLYTRNPDNLNSEETLVVQLFESVKKEVETAQAKLQDPEIRYDLYMSYHEKDTARVEEIKTLMLQEKKDLKIFSEQQELDQESVWQKGIYDVMKTCRRIITFLSPSYLESRLCVEQFNIALCCNRGLNRDLLAPFYIVTIEEMPTYIAMVQYVDCRIRDGSTNKFMNAVKTFTSIFKMENRVSLLKPLSIHYDIFISYAHKNATKARSFLTVLERLNPEFNIFFDKNELRTGRSWQLTLYKALDNADIILTLLSPEYLASSVCQEEYNVALARHFSEDHECELVPVMIEPMTSLPSHCTKLEIIDATSQFEKNVAQICKDILNFKAFDDKLHSRIFSNVEVPMDIPRMMEGHRKETFERLFDTSGDVIRRKHSGSTMMINQADGDQKEHEDPEQSNHKPELADPEAKGNAAQNRPQLSESGEKREVPNSSSEVFDIVFCGTEYKYIMVLHALLKARAPNLRMLNFDGSEEKDQLAFIETAKLVIIFLSPNYIHSGNDVEEFHVALARHRKMSGGPCMYVIQACAIPKWPTYFHLVPCTIALQDSLWKDLVKAGKNLPQDVTKIVKEIMIKLGKTVTKEMLLALSAACDDVLTSMAPQKNEDRNLVLTNVVSIEMNLYGDGQSGAQLVPIVNRLKHLIKDPMPAKTVASSNSRGSQQLQLWDESQLIDKVGTAPIPPQGSPSKTDARSEEPHQTEETPKKEQQQNINETPKKGQEQNTDDTPKKGQKQNTDDTPKKGQEQNTVKTSKKRQQGSNSCVVL